jgi:hypothetical protein
VELEELVTLGVRDRFALLELGTNGCLELEGA